MIVRKNLKWQIVIRNAWPLIVSWCVLATIAYVLYFVFGVKTIALPFAPVGVLGTALSIFLGFRNSSSYDRWWEARKIWGGIVNYSRTFGRQVITLGTLQHAKGGVSENELKDYHRELIYRHLAWINSLRLQLRQQMQPEHWQNDVRAFLPADEAQQLEKARNKSSQLLLAQGKSITAGMQRGIFEDFRHIQLDNTLTELSNLQGAAERIKNTPLPRQYNFFNLLFMHVFVFLLPFSLLETFEKAQQPMLLIPFTVIVGFVFYVVEGVGRRNEDPFENKITDTPMTALCRTIEIDLRQMLGEENLPPKAEPKDGYLF
jgi:ion channel-forming bestrophin family protein